MKKIISVLATVFFLQFVLIFEVAKSSRKTFNKIIYILLVAVFIGITWSSFYASLKDIFHILSNKSTQITLIDKINDSKTVNVSGRSMMPTIKDGSQVTLKNPIKLGISRLDIVSIKNQETDGMYYLKRIVGMPGENISIKNGYVTINDQVLDEPYVFHQSSTYGNTSILECLDYKIPPNHFAVFGDNRLASTDSRVIGLIKKDDVEGVIKTNLKVEYLTQTQKQNVLSKSIDSKKFVEELNIHRNSTSSGSLRFSEKLNSVAAQRGQIVNDQFDSWKQKLVPLEGVLDKSNYRYNLAHEYITFGYLDEKSLVEQIIDSSKEKKKFLSSEYLDVGVSTVQRSFGSCSYPIITVIIAWPSNPEYSEKEINYWATEVKTTKLALSSLQQYIGDSTYDQAKVRRYITAMARLNQIANYYHTKVKNSEWFDKKQNERDKNEYSYLVGETNKLDQELFPR
ncbi:MAG: signal peptidase I [bacterium]|nr:signal peptidase I [bacterium]